MESRLSRLLNGRLPKSRFQNRDSVTRKPKMTVLPLLATLRLVDYDVGMFGARILVHILQTFIDHRPRHHHLLLQS